MSEKKIYMMVTQDKYELPMAIADTPAELAEIVGTTRNAISSAISKARAHGYHSRYVKVTVESEV